VSDSLVLFEKPDYSKPTMLCEVSYGRNCRLGS